jgi:hypothetical protein
MRPRLRRCDACSATAPARFRSPQPRPRSATCSGSAGAVEALVTVLCLLRSEVHPMPEAGEADDAFELDLVLGRPRRSRPRDVRGVHQPGVRRRQRGVGVPT